MAFTLQVDIVSAEAEIFSGTAQMVFLPAIMGEIGVLPHHSPLLTPLRAGEVRVQVTELREESFFISGGLAEIQPYIVTVLSDTAVRAHDLDEAAALEAKRRAEKVLADRHDQLEYAKAETQLLQAIAQLQMIQRNRIRTGQNKEDNPLNWEMNNK
jgi:F-type H+-transporting ATPase subunit epsilon